MRRSLLLIAGAIGSVSAVAAALREVRNAVDLFGEPPARVNAPRSVREGETGPS